MNKFRKFTTETLLIHEEFRTTLLKLIFLVQCNQITHSSFIVSVLLLVDILRHEMVDMSVNVTNLRSN